MTNTVFQQKKRESIHELKDWLEKPNARQDRYERIIKEIDDKVANNTLTKAIFRQFDYLDLWYTNHFVYDCLSSGDKSYQNAVAFNGYHVIIIADYLAQKFPGNPPGLLFNNIMYWLANNLISLRYNEARQLTGIVIKGLKTSFLEGGLNFKPTAWFILELCNRNYSLNEDLTVFNYPTDMGVYKEVLTHWNTIDIVQVDNIVSKMCEFHLSSASFGTVNNVANIQFDRAAEFVYAYEVLTWLSIRQMNRLPNPSQFQHPMMQEKLNQLPNEAQKSFDENRFQKVMQQLKVKFP